MEMHNSCTESFCTGDDWKKKWRNQRDIYRKKMMKILSKKGSAEAERAKTWCFLDAMSFLEELSFGTKNM
jgi:hypothetical protein